MAERRMFSKTIIDSDLFMDLPTEAQALYFHLGMRADDDGFIGNSKKLCRMLGVDEENLRVLIDNELIIKFDSGVIAVRHWKKHNYIAKDRYSPTVYTKEKSTVTVDEKGMYTDCIQPVYKASTQDRLGKDSIGKDSLDKDSLAYISPSGDGADAQSAGAEQSNKKDFSFSSAGAEQSIKNSYSASSASPKADSSDTNVKSYNGAPKYPKKAQSSADDFERYLHPKFENLPKKGRSGGFDYKDAWEAALARSGIEY